MSGKKKVVVVGGGVAGSKIAKDLEDIADVTLIDPKDYFEIPYSAPRSLVEPSFADRTLLQYDEFLKGVTRVQSTAAEATATEVITASGERIPYNFLVIATGTTFTGCATKEERLKEFELRYKKIADAESVLVIGGGPVGVELAAEIVTDFPKKKVTLVTRGPHLIEFLGPKPGEKTENWFKKKGVEVILSDSLDLNSVSPPNFETKEHVAIKADHYIVAVGKKIASGWLAASKFLNDDLTENGQIKVEPTTQVVGHPNVFAAGDITDFKEMKQGFLALRHADIVVGNIKKLLNDPNDQKLLVYKPLQKPLGVVTLGRVDGLLVLPFMSLIGWLPGKIKSKDFFVGKARGELGLPK
jgi:NADH dehydrogenase FAD-containing subunit